MLTDSDLELIRDEIGATPDDDELFDMFDQLGHWLPVAIRVLKRRRADATTSAGAKSFSLDGVLSVGLSTTDIRALDGQIARLEAEWANYGKTSTNIGRITRRDR